MGNIECCCDSSVQSTGKLGYEGGGITSKKKMLDTSDMSNGGGNYLNDMDE